MQSSHGMKGRAWLRREYICHFKGIGGAVVLGLDWEKNGGGNNQLGRERVLFLIQEKYFSS